MCEGTFKGTWDMCAVLSGDERLSAATDWMGNQQVLRKRLCSFPSYAPCEATLYALPCTSSVMTISHHPR